MQRAVTALMAVAILVCLLGTGARAGCPFASKRKLLASSAQAGTETTATPADHPPMETSSTTSKSRKLLQLSEVTPAYIEAFQKLVADFETVIGTCQFSIEGMAYRDNTDIVISSTNAFFPAAAWLRGFFHDAGTFISQPSKGGPKGGPNGSLGVGCPNNNCGSTTAPVNVTAGTTCANGARAVSGFTDGKSYCCPSATQCISMGQSANNGPTPGRVVPVCLTGSPETVELCRRENDGLLSMIQFYRGRQANPTFQVNTTSGLKPLSMADIIVAGAVVVVKQCSGGQLNIEHTLGRPDALVADDTGLPSVSDFLEDRHAEIFQQMGLNKIDMLTVVTGSHSIGGFRRSSSGSQTSCPMVPFDCTPAGQFASPPFDNDVFKVACNGVQGISSDPSTCAFNTRCTNPFIDESMACPFDLEVREAFQTKCGGIYPTPGLASDKALCQDPSTRQRMVLYAQDQDFFFSKYKDTFLNLATLGFKNKGLVYIQI